MILYDKIGIILLAAGTSTRMGNINKLTMPFAGKPLIYHSAYALSTAHVGSLHLITGHQADDVSSALLPLAPHIIHNDHHHLGMGHSIATAVTALRPHYDHLMIALGDTPHITDTHVRKLAISHLANPAPRSAITRPLFGRDYGHPVIWGANYFNQLCALSGDKGAQHLINPQKSTIVFFEETQPAKDYDCADDF